VEQQLPKYLEQKKNDVVPMEIDALPLNLAHGLLKTTNSRKKDDASSVKK